MDKVIFTEDGYYKIHGDDYGDFYNKFVKSGATAKHKALDLLDIFGNDMTDSDESVLHKTVAYNIVRRKGDKYWLCEKSAKSRFTILKQRIGICTFAVVFALIILLLKQFGVLSF